jgi:serine protease AprX
MKSSSILFGQRFLRVVLCFSLIFVVLVGSVGSGFALSQDSAPAPASTIVDQKLDSALTKKLSSVSALTPLEVIIVFSDVSAAARVRPLASKFFQMQSLPMAGAILTAKQIKDLANWSEIHSITLNQPLKYFLHESVSFVKADQVWSTYGETGSNATVAVIDSGIDGSHPDLPFGSKVVQNVKVLPYELSQENVQITDTTSGHGTHVAGTIGGTGAASDGYYRGVAPGVKLVGLGAGEGL